MNRTCHSCDLSYQSKEGCMCGLDGVLVRSKSPCPEYREKEPACDLCGTPLGSDHCGGICPTCQALLRARRN